MREVREPLFRAKRVDTNEWIEGYYCLCVFGSFPAEPCIICADELEIRVPFALRNGR